MANQLTSMDVLKQTLITQNTQGQALVEMLDYMEEVKDEMVDMKQEIKTDIKELRDSITLNPGEIKMIQSAVGTKSWELTKEYFKNRNVSDDLFLAKLGHLRQGVYHHLKTALDVGGPYTTIKRIEFQKALNILSSLELSDLSDYKKRLTPRQIEIANLHNDDISGLR